jgi:WhiB family redox-sensing transcriptional regulator
MTELHDMSTLWDMSFAAYRDETIYTRMGPIRPTYQWESSATPLEWQEDALCAQIDPEMFFPEKGGSTKDAKAICASCDVREKCLQYALENNQRFGVWGGLSERQRRLLRRQL